MPPATEYVAMPDGSSSAAPVMTPGPSDFKSNRVHRTGANAGAAESERTDLFIAVWQLGLLGLGLRLVVENDV